MSSRQLNVEVQANAFLLIGRDSTRDFVRIVFNRTLRIPDDGATHSLPPAIGNFPIHSVDEFRDTVPQKWLRHGGIFLPMYQREAMWMQFEVVGKPKCIKVGVGKVNAVNGEPWNEEMLPVGQIQDYLVVPSQRWLDGINSGDGTIKQFVAMPLGSGYTVEGQVTGEEKFGGVQLCVYDALPGALDRPTRVRRYEEPYYSSDSDDDLDDLMEECECEGGEEAVDFCFGDIPPAPSMMESKKSMPRRRRRRRGRGRNRAAAAEMGMAAGGTMRQTIVADPHGRHVWDPNAKGRVFIHIVNSEMYTQITGMEAPPCPVTRRHYDQHGYPWYNYYDEVAHHDVPASANLSTVQSIGTLDSSSSSSSSHGPIITVISSQPQPQPNVHLIGPSSTTGLKYAFPTTTTTTSTTVTSTHQASSVSVVVDETQGGGGDLSGLESRVELLCEMGFEDESLNRFLLTKHNLNVQKVAKLLIRMIQLQQQQ